MDKKRLTPEEGKGKKDNMTTTNSWILLTVDGKITICNQKIGEESTGKVTLTKKEFERFILFYQIGR